MKNLNTILNKKLKDPKFKKVFNEYEKEFQIAQELIMLRTKAGLTQSELAKKAKTSQSAIARIESGEHKNVTISLLKKLGDALGAVPEVHFRKVHSLKA